MQRLTPILIVFAILGSRYAVSAQDNKPDSAEMTLTAEEEKLQTLTEKVRRSLFVMIRVGQEVLTEYQPTTNQQPEARILNDGTPVYSSKYDTTSLMDYLDRDARFPVLDQQPGYLRIQIDSGTEGWIRSAAAFISGGSGSQTNLVTTLSNNSLKQVEVIHRLNRAIESSERIFDKEYNKLRFPGSAAKAIRKEFYRHFTNARTYYQTNFAGITISPARIEKRENRLSGVIQISGGSSVFSDRYSESLKEEFRGSLQDISLNAVYRLDQTSSINLLLSTRSEVLQTPFKTNHYQAGYRKQTETTRLQLGVDLNQYKDNFRGINSYNRLLLNGGVTHNINKNQRVYAKYQLLQNNYTAESTSDYTRHQLATGIESVLRNNNQLLLNLRGDVSTSTSARLNFLHLLPSLTYRKRTQSGTTDYLFSFESFSYDSLSLRNSTRGTFGISSRKREDVGRSRTSEFLLTYITYKDNNTVDHVRVSIRNSKNSFVGRNTFSTFGLTTKYFMNNIEASYLDLRYDVGSNNKTYTELALFNRFYYPEETALSLLEANLKVGANIWGMRLGPVLSFRGTINFNDFNLKADGNYVRLGAFLEGAKVFKNGFQFSINAAYDYGNVYSQETIIDTDTGLITYGEGSARNPTTLRISFQASYPVLDLFDVFLHFDHYNIDRDFMQVSGLNPILSSDRLAVKAGFVYRYN